MSIKLWALLWFLIGMCVMQTALICVPESYTRRLAEIPHEITSDWRCEPRKRCTAIQTCEEAKWRLRVCQDTSLDKDGDGVPCETLCK